MLRPTRHKTTFPAKLGTSVLGNNAYKYDQQVLFSFMQHKLSVMAALREWGDNTTQQVRRKSTSYRGERHSHQGKCPSFLQSHIFVVKKRRMVTGGTAQRGHVTKEESSSPTVSARRATRHEGRYYQNGGKAETESSYATPICNGILRGMFGYNAVTSISRKILTGTYTFPPEFDEATQEILQECAAFRLLVPENSVSTTITKEDWREHWR